jgi:hypothetical protein
MVIESLYIFYPYPRLSPAADNCKLTIDKIFSKIIYTEN